LAAPTSLTPVLAALAGNTFVTIIKLVAFVLSGSGAMLSESIHSFADTGNQLLLFVGLKRGQRPADDQFHYGYGGERFVFGMLSAAGIFFIGCGITIYHGVTSLLEQHEVRASGTTFLVLATAFVIEGGVLVFAVRGIYKLKGTMGFWEYVRERGDPATVAILLEDGAAVLGVVLAAIGIALSYFTGNPVFDAITSLVIGLLLGVIAFYLVSENREHLLGRAVPEGVEELFIDTVLDHPSVRSIRDVKTRELTTESYILKAEITFDNDHLAEQLGRLPLEALYDAARPGRSLRRMSAAVTELIATETAAIEAKVRAVIPQARHIDLEIAHPDAVHDDDEELA